MAIPQRLDVADTEAKKLLTAAAWADTGDRVDPEDEGIDRAKGWPVSYEQQGSGKFPERPVFNQLLREQSGFSQDVLRWGYLPWDAEVNYAQYAFVIGADGEKYVSNVATGPATGNATNPTAAQQTVWRVY